MPFCPECRSEYEQGYNRCASCGVWLTKTLDVPAEAHDDGPPPRYANLDWQVAYEQMLEVNWPMRESGDPIEPAAVPGELYSDGFLNDRHYSYLTKLPEILKALEYCEIPALLVLNGSTFDGVSVFGVTLEAENIYIPATLLDDFIALRTQPPVFAPVEEEPDDDDEDVFPWEEVEQDEA